MLLHRPNEEEFLWRGADTKTVLNGTATLHHWEFSANLSLLRSTFARFWGGTCDPPRWEEGGGLEHRVGSEGGRGGKASVQRRFRAADIRVTGSEGPGTQAASMAACRGNVAAVASWWSSP